MTEKQLFAPWRGHTPGLMGASAEYAVLVPLVCPKDGEPSLLFEVRSDTLRRQPGEVCFPGGKLEPGEVPERCALRETEEELGIPPSAVEIIGPMDFICNQSGFLLRPILGKLTDWDPVQARPNPSEVAEVFAVPVGFFRDPPQVFTYQLKPEVPSDFPYGLVGISPDYPWRGGTVEVPVYRWRDRAIWGMTARITKSLMETDR